MNDSANAPTKTPEKTPGKVKAENPLINLAFNIVIPVLILQKGSKPLGPGTALLLALAFPIFYGLYDLAKRKKFNFFSLLGIVNVSVTGGLALTGLGGIWFAVKEAAFPLLIGIFVAISAFSKKPFIQALIVNPQTLQWELIDSKLKELNRETDFFALLKRTTLFLALSFLLSAIINFVVAVRIFIPIDPTLSELDRANVLNDQIGDMTSVGFAVTFFPSMIVLSAIMFYLLRGMSKTTGLTLEQMMK